MIELEVIERKWASISELLQSFGRVLDFLIHKLSSEKQRNLFLPNLPEDLIERWEWCLNIYYEVELLIYSLFIDQLARFSDLNTSKIYRNTIYESLLHFCLYQIQECNGSF